MSTDYEKLGAFYLGRPVDPATGTVSPEPLLYDSRDLTTHAVCVGMTGSGKTGLCLALLEEAAIDGVPALCIDPKGDLGNLLLNFPTLQAADFAPWIDGGEAARRGRSIDEHAAQVAQQWREGLAGWQQGPERIARLRDAVDMAIYTPGADDGLPLSVLGSFAAPEAGLRSDTAALAERANGMVAGLLTLLGREADPLQSREHILLAQLVVQAWADGRSLDIATLVGLVQKPPFERLGALDLESFYPARERMALALALNNLLASPGFAAWTQGEALDVQRLLYTPEGKPRIAILSIAHLSDTERMFIVTLVLNEMLAWMRRQTGTSSLRAILYMDEIFGYFPPNANPPSKPPMLTLLKQARAFGLGCVLATQNPVDLDYKGLGNTGTWLVGRLQTERDRERLIDGLVSGGGSGLDRAELARLLASLPQRSFLMRNVHDDAPVLLQSRWALSYLRGPLALPEIARLMAARKQTGAATSVRPVASAVAAPVATDRGAVATRPALPAGIDERFVPLKGVEQGITYRPLVLAAARLHFVDAKAKVDVWQDRLLQVALPDAGHAVDWSAAEPALWPLAALAAEPVAGAQFAEVPAAAARAANYAAWGKSLGQALYQTERLTLQACDALKLCSLPDESTGDFRARLALALREQRDEAVAALRAKYATRLTTAQNALQRAEDRVAREQQQASQQKLHTAVSIGTTLLGALLGGGRRMSAGTLGRAGTAARAASRAAAESADVERANEALAEAQQKLADLQAECEADLAALQASLDIDTLELREQQIAPRKADILVGAVVLVWLPWRNGTDGFPAPAY